MGIIRNDSTSWGRAFFNNVSWQQRRISRPWRLMIPWSLNRMRLPSQHTMRQYTLVCISNLRQQAIKSINASATRHARCKSTFAREYDIPLPTKLKLSQLINLQSNILWYMYVFGYLHTYTRLFWQDISYARGCSVLSHASGMSLVGYKKQPSCRLHSGPRKRPSAMHRRVWLQLRLDWEFWLSQKL